MSYLTCEGCKDEMEECFMWQSNGFDAGLTWKEGHCFVFVLDKNGEFIIE